MSVQLWIVVAFLGLSLIVQPLNIGEPREPRTAATAVAGIVINASMILLVLWGANP